MKTVQAVNDKIVVEVLKEDEKTEGGIIIPSTAEKDPQGYGRVISIGEDISTIQEGDILLFAKFGGQDMMIERRILKVLCYGEIYGILKQVEE